MNRTWKQGVFAMPGVGFALLPKLACPFCWPAYASLLSSVGLGFLISTKYLLPLTAAFLVLALGALALGARHRHGYGPFLVGLIATIVVVTGKFAWDSRPALYAAVATLVAASVWNAWPQKMSRNENLTARSCCKGVEAGIDESGDHSLKEGASNDHN
jgi:mercuric ion transport protein